jgi:hypothetical protein
MATIKEQIARHTRAEATQQQPIADDPLAPTPIRFTHWRDADGSSTSVRSMSLQPAGTWKTMPRLRMLNHCDHEARPTRPPTRRATTSSRRG